MAGDTWDQSRSNVFRRLDELDDDMREARAQTTELLKQFASSEARIASMLENQRIYFDGLKVNMDRWKETSSAALEKVMGQKVEWLDGRFDAKLTSLKKELTTRMDKSDEKIECNEKDIAKLKTDTAILGVKISPAMKVIAAVIAFLTTASGVGLVIARFIH